MESLCQTHRTLLSYNARCSCLGFNAQEIRDETTIRSEERGIEESKKLRNVNEKLLQFPISSSKKGLASCYLQEDTENSLTLNRSSELFFNNSLKIKHALDFNVIIHMCKSLLKLYVYYISLLKYVIFVTCNLRSEFLILFICN